MASTKEISAQELLRHRKEGDMWLAIEGKVFDVSNFTDHPGGVEILLQHSGKDATEAFLDQGHTRQARLRFPKYEIGTLQKFPTEDAGFTVTRQKPKGIGNCVRMTLAVLLLVYLLYRLL